MDNNKNFVNITPQESLELDFEQSFKLLESLIGKDKLNQALKFEIESPATNKGWHKTAKIVGINPRITKTFWGIVKYAMTFPENAIHLMPLFETGDGSLYVQNSWKINSEFLDKDLAAMGFETPEKQLKLIINILHAMGKIVGFDCLPHVDNFSEITILNPSCFEWIKLNEAKTAQDFSIEPEETEKNIEKILIKELNLPKNIFSLNEKERESIIFPCNIDRFERRMQIRQIIRNNGYEPIPVVEHSPMRPLEFEKLEQNKNENWAVFKVKDKAQHAKIIGSNTPYKFYKIKERFPLKNQFDEKVVNYFISHVYNFQKEYGFDFLRADMAHNQTAHSHNEDKDMVCPEIWAMLKEKIQKNKPYFATFAESFWGNYYISGIQDMLNKKFDIVLGKLNFSYLDKSYTEKINQYLSEYRTKYPFYPCVTVFTNDGDLPCHDSLYTSQEANDCRFFISLFLNLPSYTGMGFETRDLTPNCEQKYSNPYVKKQPWEFQFGTNEFQFKNISDMRSLYCRYKNIIENAEFFNVDTNNDRQLCWYYVLDNNKKLLFCVNLNPDKNYIETNLNNINQVNLVYTNSQYEEIEANNTQNVLVINNIYIGECVVYEIE